MASRTVDRVFLTLVLVLLAGGFFIFSSAALGLLARDGAGFAATSVKQLVSIGIGLAAMFLLSRTPYKAIHSKSFYIALAAYAATFLVFIPGLGFSHNGAARWISVFGFSLQPAEFLKLGFIVYYAAVLASVRPHISQMKFALAPLVALLILVFIPLKLQPDMGTFVVIAATGFLMLIAGGARFLHVTCLAAVATLFLVTLALSVPYMRERVNTFLDPERDPHGASWQVNQSLIAVGSGQWFGRGFGQSVQKFEYLPEPIGDSIFAVFAEEWGFAGTLALLALILALTLRGYMIASRAPTVYARQLVAGLVSLIAIESFINIASMLGLFPLTGIPLLFVSHGGTAMLMALAAAGMILSVSRHERL